MGFGAEKEGNEGLVAAEAAGLVMFSSIIDDATEDDLDLLAAVSVKWSKSDIFGESLSNNKAILRIGKKD